MSICCVALGLMCLTIAERQGTVDAISVLRAAHQSVVERRQSHEFQFTTVQIPEPNPDSGIEPIEVTGTWRFANGHECLDAKLSDRSDVEETHYAFDGIKAKLLRISGLRKLGSILPQPRMFPPQFGSFLIKGELHEAGAPGSSIFEHLLHDADLTTRRGRTETDRDGNELIRVRGHMPWGDYEVLVDPGRGYNMVRFQGNIDDSRHPSYAWSRYEFDCHELRQIHGHWYPVRGTMLHVFAPSVEGASVQSHYTSITEMIVHDVVRHDDAVEAARFDFNWPAGTRVTDYFAGYTYTQLKEGRLKNPLDQMMHAVLADRDAAVSAEVGAGELAALGIELGSQPETTSLPPQICAIGCAYAILKLEGHTDLTTRELIRQLKPLASGRVATKFLADALRAYGLRVTPMRGLTPGSLGQADERVGLYVLVLTAPADGRTDQRLNHVMLYRRTDEKGHCVVVSPPGVSRFRPDDLKKRWAGGYALIAARDEAILKEFVRDVQSPLWAGLGLPATVAVAVATLAILMARRWQRSGRGKRADPVGRAA